MKPILKFAEKSLPPLPPEAKEIRKYLVQTNMNGLLFFFVDIAVASVFAACELY